MIEKNSLIPNMYITQYRLRSHLNQIAFHPSIFLRIYGYRLEKKSDLSVILHLNSVNLCNLTNNPSKRINESNLIGSIV
jgi:hypothetical protein